MSAYRKAAFSAYASACFECGSEGADINPLEVHHVDHNRTNNDITNLQILCRLCHRRAHRKHSDGDNRIILAVEVDPDLKRWLERKSAERIIEGRPHGERSMGAVIRDILAAAQESEKEGVAA